MIVRWPLARLHVYASVIPETLSKAALSLVALLNDPNAHLRSMAITSLAVIVLRASPYYQIAVNAISPLTLDRNPAVAKRARTALRSLTDPSFELPRLWVKK